MHWIIFCSAVYLDIVLTLLFLHLMYSSWHERERQFSLHVLSQAARETSLTACLDFNQWCSKLMLVLKTKTVTVYSSAGNTVSFKNQNFKKETKDAIWQVNTLQFKSIRMKIPLNNKGTCY